MTEHLSAQVSQGSDPQLYLAGVEGSCIAIPNPHEAKINHDFFQKASADLLTAPLPAVGPKTQ